MDPKDLEFQKRILSTFRVEAEEHIQLFSANLIELEKTHSKKKMAELIEVMFREVHSLKGAARSVDQKDIENVCLPLESIFSTLKRREIDLAAPWFDLFHQTVDFLLGLIDTIGVEQTWVFRQTQQELIRSLKEKASGTEAAGLAREATAADLTQSPLHAQQIPEIERETSVHPDNLPTHIGMVRIPISKLDPLLLQAEEMMQSKISANQRSEELRDLCDELKQWKTETQKWRSRKFSATADLWNEWFDTSEIQLNKVENRMLEIGRAMERDQHSLHRMVNNHLETMKQVLMLPVSSLVETFPGMVREIAREQDKEIDFVIRGTELEIDKRILEELKDPLIHLIRNSIDHGIGKPQERLLQNKPTRGCIALTFDAKESGQVEITLSDDGKGIDLERLIKAAIKSGILSAEDAKDIEPPDALNLIYHSGISTSTMITDISGHGLGLSIVHEKVTKLNGKIAVESELHMGTTFRLLLPMTLATFRGIVVIVNDSLFILPTMNVERVMKVEQTAIKSIERHATFCMNDQIISVAGLGEVLGLAEGKHPGQGGASTGLTNTTQICIVVLVSGKYRMAFKVDDVDEEQQVLVKGLGKLLYRVRNISGATILGSGKVVPVLNVSDLMKSAIALNGTKTEAPPGEYELAKPGKILVAEDSITSRTLLKNILQTAGYQVTISVDGADAYTKARAGDFDIIVSDVDMPKMNGFELTAKIRSDKKLVDIPVVLVTSLESRDDREHGIEVGADAYIIKSSFDQTNLLEVIKRLI